MVLKTTTRQTIFLPVIGLVDGGARGFSFFFSRSVFPFVLSSATRRDVRRASLTRTPPKTLSCLCARARRLNIRRTREQTR